MKVSVTLVFVVLLSGCVDINILPQNEIIINDEQFPLVNGYYIDIGMTDSIPGNVKSPSPTHYNEFFIMTNGYLINGEFNESTTYLLFVDLYAKGEKLIAGKYEMEGELISNADGKAIGRLVFQQFTGGQDGVYECKEGTLSFSGKSPKRSFTFNVKVERTTIIDDIEQTKIFDLTGQFTDTFTTTSFNLN